MEENNALTQQHLDDSRHQILSLIQLTKDITGHTRSLQNIWLLAKPSQRFPKNTKSYKKQGTAKLDALSTSELIQCSKANDKKCQEQFDALLHEVEAINASTKSEQTLTELPADLSRKMHSFNKVTEASVRIRLQLQDEGVVLPHVRFSISSELIGEYIAEIIETNKLLKKRLTTKIRQFIKDVGQIIKLGDTAIDRTQLMDVQATLTHTSENLHDEDALNSVGPTLMALDTNALINPALSHDQQAERKEPAVKDLTPDKTDKTEPSLSATKKLKIWLNSGWNKQWKDID